MAIAGKFNIQVGSLKQSRSLAAEDVAELRALFAQLKATIDERAPADLRRTALARAEQLEHAVLGEQPNPRTVGRTLRWFRAHAPALLPSVEAVLAHPLVERAT
jgi:hypothetical protein